MPWPQVFQRLQNIAVFKHSKTYSPIVAEKEITKLRQLASQAAPTELDLNLEVHHRMLGEQLSPFAKNGFEFAETRLYQHGDNIRFINWRRYANTGQLYINSFHEERRPQCWIVLDRRASMRFGSKVRLKVAQAANLALYNLLKAQHQQLDVGCVILDEQSHWYNAQSANTFLQPVIEHICSACPPCIDQQPQQMSETLRVLKARLQPGGLIVLISDFLDLQERDSNTLNALSEQHTVYAIHIVDPIEKTLPAHGKHPILNPNNESVMLLNCEQHHSKQKIEDLLQQRLKSIEQLLKNCRAYYVQVDSSEDLISERSIAL